MVVAPPDTVGGGLIVGAWESELCPGRVVARVAPPDTVGGGLVVGGEVGKGGTRLESLAFLLFKNRSDSAKMTWRPLES